MEKLYSQSSEIHNNTTSLHDHMGHIPSWIEVILVMPQNPAAITEKINKYRSLQAQKDEKKLQSIHDYYSQAA